MKLHYFASKKRFKTGGSSKNKDNTTRPDDELGLDHETKKSTNNDAWRNKLEHSFYILYVLFVMACCELVVTDLHNVTERILGAEKSHKGGALEKNPANLSGDETFVIHQTETATETPAPPSFVPPQCTASQRQALLDSLNIHNQRQTLVAGTNCPREDWLVDYFASRKSFDPAHKYLGINIGCNKGLDAVAMARMLSRDDKFRIQPWRASAGGGRQMRPVCGMPAEIPIKPATNTSKGTIHCIEPMPSTVERLQQAQQATQYSDIQIKQLAMSNTTGTTMFPNMGAGFEGSSLQYCQQKQDDPRCVAVPLMTLDDYMQQLDGNINTNDQEKAKIDMLLVDAEGFDYEVLQGGHQTLERVRYLTFEVHQQGNWPKHSLVELVETTLSQFNCYWTGNNQLYRITDCLDPTLSNLYDTRKKWSNVVCVHHNEVELGEIMEHNFLNLVGPADGQAAVM